MVGERLAMLYDFIIIHVQTEKNGKITLILEFVQETRQTNSMLDKQYI